MKREISDGVYQNFYDNNVYYLEKELDSSVGTQDITIEKSGIYMVFFNLTCWKASNTDLLVNLNLTNKSNNQVMKIGEGTLTTRLLTNNHMVPYTRPHFVNIESGEYQIGITTPAATFDKDKWHYALVYLGGNQQ